MDTYTAAIADHRRGANETEGALTAGHHHAAAKGREHGNRAHRRHSVHQRLANRSLSAPPRNRVLVVFPVMPS